MGNILNIDKTQFDKVVLESEKPVVVDFYSTDCPPCEALAPKFELLEEIYGSKALFVKIFRQGNRELAETLSVKSSPTVLFYKNGKEMQDRLTGYIRRSELKKHIERLLGVKDSQTDIKKDTKCDVLILGSGVAGLSAAIYTSRAKLSTIVVDENMAGGQTSWTQTISNYPGFKDGIAGKELTEQIKNQALRFGTEFREVSEITTVSLKDKFIVLDGLERISSKYLIIATGAKPRLLGVPGEKEFAGRGVSYCATCDAEHFKDKTVAVIGGGNSALEESLYIAKFASNIVLIHQFDNFQATPIIQEEFMKLKNLKIHFSCEPRAFIGKTALEAVEFEELKTHKIQKEQVSGVFVFAGLSPATDIFKKELPLDQFGYITTNDDMETSIFDVFAVGDVRTKKVRQISTAIGDAVTAAVIIEKRR